MLRSMTGHGEARKQVQDKRLSVEVRSVNHRHLKVVVRGPDWFQAREAEVEKVARRFAKRGSLTVHLDWRTDEESSGGRLNLAVIDSYIDQLKSRIPKVPVEILGAILFLPGVASVGSAEPSDHSEDWATVE